LMFHSRYIFNVHIHAVMSACHLMLIDLCITLFNYLNQRLLTFWLLRTPTESLLEAADP
jgi:hypothetical protein